MKNFIVLLFFVPLFASAQKTHTVQAKETLYSLARKYNVHPRELASYNNIPVETSLSVGQVIKIPANKTMAPLTSDPAPKTEQPVKPETVTKTPTPVAPVKKEGPNPIYHKVEKKQTLYAISKLYPNVTIDDIKKWNKLTGDGVSEGTNLIVGYGKAASTKPIEPEKKKEETKAVVKETSKTIEPEKKEVTKVVKPEPDKKEEPTNVTGKNFKGGVFKALFEKQTGDKNVKEERGAASVFKSTSGWDDGKYYCLTNSAAPGSVVKITNPSNQRSIYAKVLDLIPELKQNAGIIIRISNSAASELGVSTDHFESIVNF